MGISQNGEPTKSPHAAVAAQDGEEGGADVDRTSLGMNLARKILNNITVELEEVHIAFINSSRGLACCVDLPNLAVLSTDQTYRPRDDTEGGAVVPGQSMYKTLQLQKLSVSNLTRKWQVMEAEYVLCPVSANLQLAHEPANNLLSLIKLLVATEELAEVFLRRSQVQHLRSLKSHWD
eukprot:Skav232925  [mRNA]  locus=scaffold1477:843532:850485:- [translate_table: standard]